MMSYIGAAVIVVSLYLITPISGETLFKCQGETVILEFEKVEIHHGTSTVNWYMKQNEGRPKLIAYKADKDEPIVQVPFAHYAEIDSDLNLVLRNVSSELNGEYFRRIVNGGIFNSSVNLYVMYAPSGKPIVSKEKSGSGKESFNLEMPYLGKPEANVTIKPLKMNITNVAGAIQQYEICLSGRSLQCLEESLCQNFTIRIGQSGIPMQDVEKAPCQNSTIKNESPKTERLLEKAMTVFVIYTVAGSSIVLLIYIFLLFYFKRCKLKNKVNWLFGIGCVTAVIAVLFIIDFFVNGFVLKAVFGILVNLISHLGLLFIVVLLVRRETYTESSAGQNFEESEEIVNGMDQMCVDETDQNDDVRPGSSNSV